MPWIKWLQFDLIFPWCHNRHQGLTGGRGHSLKHVIERIMRRTSDTLDPCTFMKNTMFWMSLSLPPILAQFTCTLITLFCALLWSVACPLELALVIKVSASFSLHLWAMQSAMILHKMAKISNFENIASLSLGLCVCMSAYACSDCFTADRDI